MHEWVFYVFVIIIILCLFCGDDSDRDTTILKPPHRRKM